MTRKTMTMTMALGLAAALLMGCDKPQEKQAAATPAATAEPVVELNFGHVQSVGAHHDLLGHKLAELAAQKSNGSLKITVFPAAQLGGELKMIQALRAGTQSLTAVGTAVSSNTVPEYQIFDLPYLFDSSEQADKLLAGPVGRKYLGMLDKHGLVGLGFVANLERNVFANKAIRTVDDMKSLKLRTLQAPGHIKAFEALGAQPTPMAYSEIYISMQQGAVDGADTAADQFITDKFTEVAKNYNLTRVHIMPVFLVVSKLQFDKLTPNQQKALREAAAEAAAYDIEIYKKQVKESLDKARQVGVNVVETDLTGMKKKAMTAYDGILKDVPNGQDLLKEIRDAKAL